MSDAPPRPDQVPGAPHPRETPQIFGQQAAEEAFLQAYTSGRLHHGWLITGPKGVGKATLAYRIARFLLATPPQDTGGLFGAPPPPTSLDIGSDHPVIARVSAESEPGLRVVIRTPNEKTGRMQDEITVKNIRKLGEFFHLSIADGGRRVVIIDVADELRTEAANALLKMLEEPPAATTLLLLAHQPARLLPTIRSRCRTLALSPLHADDLLAALRQAGTDPDPSASEGLAQLSGGSVGGALNLLNNSGLEIYAELVELFGSMPNLDRTRARALADAAAQRGAEAKLDLLIDLLSIALARLARHGALGPAPEAAPREADAFAKLAPTPWAARQWAEDAATISGRLRHGRAVNLDPAVLVLDTLIKLNDTASRLSTQSQIPA